MIPFNSFQYQHNTIRYEIIQATTDTYDANWYILGERLTKFEAEFSTYLKTDLDAIKIALKAVGLGAKIKLLFLPLHFFQQTLLSKKIL